jgi:hypothetical protein
MKFTANENFDMIAETRFLIFHTLMHFSVYSGGQTELLCDLQGSYKMLSDPEIYGSETEVFKAFDADHVCNDYCAFLGMAQ